MANMEHQENLREKVENNKQKIDAMINKIYPVGSIYMSVNASSPSALFAGPEWKSKDDSSWDLVAAIAWAQLAAKLLMYLQLMKCQATVIQLLFIMMIFLMEEIVNLLIKKSNHLV